MKVLKNYFTINLITPYMLHSIYLYQSVSLSSSLSVEWPSSQSVPSVILTLNLLSLYSYSTVYHHWSHPVYLTYSTFFKPFTITSGDMPCQAMIMNWQRSITMSILILPAGGSAWYPVMSHTLHSHFRHSLNSLFTTASNICSCENTPPGMITTNVFI